MAKIAIVGTGFVGRAWAISFARAGHEIALWDAVAAAPAAALAYIENLLPDLQRYDLLNASTPAEIRGRMHVAAPASGWSRACRPSYSIASRISSSSSSDAHCSGTVQVICWLEHNEERAPVTSDKDFIRMTP